MVHEKQPKLSAVDRLNEANSGYLADLEHKVLKLPSFETIDQAKTASLGIMNILHDGAEISDGQILLMTAAVEEYGDTTRSTLLVITTSIVDESKTVHSVIVSSDSRKTSTVSITAPFSRSNDIYWNPETIAEATLEYIDQEKKRSLAAAAINTSL